MMLNCTDIQHDIKLHQQDLGPAWQAGSHSQAPYGARLHQGVCSIAVAKYVRGTVAGTPLIKTGWKSGCPRRGMGKVPSSLGRRAYLSRTCTTKEPSHIDGCKRLLMWDRPATGQLCACMCTCGICVCVLGLWMCLDDMSLYYTQSVSDRLSGLAQWLGCWPGLWCLLGKALDYYNLGPKPGWMMWLAHHCTHSMTPWQCHEESGFELGLMPGWTDGCRMGRPL
jgi:hypothetical protein